MNIDTEITFEAAKAGNPEYDRACKLLLMNKEILAPVLKEVVPEYQGHTIEEVISYIDEASIRPDIAVDGTSAVASAMPTEMSSVTDKIIFYDARFLAVNPKLSTEKIRFYLHIDIEVQTHYGKGKLGYPLIKRAVYYAARELGSQLGVLTEQTNYGTLEKVYSIWICNKDVPEELRNTMTSYSLTKRDIVGTTNEPDADYDLMNIIIIRRGDNDGTGNLFDYLSGIFTGDNNKVRKYVDMDRNVKVQEEFQRMSGLGLSIAKENFEKGHMQGLQQGKAEGKAEGRIEGKLKTLIDLVQDKLLSVGDAARKAGMSEADFISKMNESAAKV